MKTIIIVKKEELHDAITSVCNVIAEYEPALSVNDIDFRVNEAIERLNDKGEVRHNFVGGSWVVISNNGESYTFSFEMGARSFKKMLDFGVEAVNLFSPLWDMAKAAYKMLKGIGKKLDDISKRWYNTFTPNACYTYITVEDESLELKDVVFIEEDDEGNDPRVSEIISRGKCHGDLHEYSKRVALATFEDLRESDEITWYTSMYEAHLAYDKSTKINTDGKYLYASTNVYNSAMGIDDMVIFEKGPSGDVVIKDVISRGESSSTTREYSMQVADLDRQLLGDESYKWYDDIDVVKNKAQYPDD